MRRLGQAWLGLTLVFLYAPIGVMAAMSFNASEFYALPFRFSTEWYGRLWRNEAILAASWRSVWIALVVTGIATLLGTAAALALWRHEIPGKRVLRALLFPPIAVPWLITGTAMLTFFFGIGLGRGTPAVILGHVALALPYVIVVVSARLATFERALEEAARSLGATPWQATRAVTLPAIAPGVTAGALFAFAVSFDQFVVSYFLAEPGDATLPVLIYTAIRKGFTPEINAVSTLVILVSMAVVLLAARGMRFGGTLMAEVRVEGLSKAYGPVKALDGVTLTFPDGGFFGLLGPSGSGKTTLLRAIAGFVAPDAGRVLIDGLPVEDTPVERREIGMVFQSYALFPHMSVAENVGFGLRVRGVRGSAAAARVAEALDLVRLGDLGARKPAELSGGQRQRVAMARAIAPRPRVLLLDEPLSALDASLRQEMQVELKRIQREVGITTVFVTHDQEEALTLSDRIGLLRDGRLMREGPPREVYRDPRTTFVARFLGEANVLEGAPDPGGLRLADGTLIPLPRPAARIALRPEDLRVTPLPPPEGVRLRAELRGRVFGGATGACLLERDGARLRATGPDRAFADLPETGPVWVSWAQADALPLED